MKVIGLGLAAIAGARYTEPPSPATGELPLAHQQNPLGRRLQGRLFGAHLIVTNDSSVAYFKTPGPADGCSIDYPGTYVFLDSILRNHNTFYANCEVPRGSEKVWIDVFTMDNGDAYWDRSDYRTNFSCDLGKFSELHPGRVTSSGSVYANEVCTSSPSVSPTSGLPTTAPSVNPDEEDPAFSDAAIALIAVGSAAAVAALGVFAGRRHCRHAESTAPRTRFLSLDQEGATELQAGVVIHVPPSNAVGDPPAYSAADADSWKALQATSS